MLTKETIIGGGAPAAITYQHPMVLKNTLKANFKVIQGYKGTRDINIAMQRGEVHGTCGMFGSSVNSQFGAEVKDGRMKLFIQMGSKRSDAFGKIPSVFDYAKTDEDRAILQFHFGQLLLGRPLAGPPGIPADRLTALRKALFETMKDPQFLAEATKAGLDIDPVSPDEVMRCSSSLPPSRLLFLSKAQGRDGALSLTRMLATGRQKLERMRDGRVVYIGAERVDDVTAHPAFRRGAETVAALYDLKADPGAGATVLLRGERRALRAAMAALPHPRRSRAPHAGAARHRRGDLRLHRPLARAGRGPDHRARDESVGAGKPARGVSART